MGKRANPGSTWPIWGAVIIFQLFCCHLWGLDPHKTVDRYLVDQWEIADGIHSNTVLSINQTPDGYLWIGTSKGLVRYDGVKFVIVPYAEKEEIYSKEVRALFVDREGVLWIGSSGWLTSYRYQTGQFKTFTKESGITDDGIRRINGDMKGNLWISFDASYVNRFSNGEFTAFNVSHGFLGKKNNVIVEDGQGNLLFGTRENGIFIYKDGKFSQYPVSGLDNVFINTMYEDRSGDLWIGTFSGLFRIIGINRETGKGTRKYTVRDGLANDHISSIMEDSEGNLWVGTVKGLNRVKKAPDGTVSFESLLKSFTIMWLFEDREKSLWIGTDNSGLRRLKDGKFMSYEPFEAHAEEIPGSLFEDRHGDTWIGTFSGKLFRCRGGDLIEPAAILEPSGTGIAAIAEDAEGNLWLGTIGRGVFQKKNNHLTQFTTEGLADNLVTSIYRDSRDNLWFSTFDGVSVLRSRDRIIESLKSGDGLAGKVVHNVYETKAGDILIAADKGITILTKVFADASRVPGGQFFQKAPPLSFTEPKAILQGVSVTCIYEDSSAPDPGGSIYWIATEGTGLHRLILKDGTVTSSTSYTTAHGMTTNFLYQFFEDPQGYFWLMSNSGILRVSKHELNLFASDDVDKINCISFGISDGMKSLEFDNIFSRNSALKTGDGEFWFITKKGISIVNPEKIRFNQTPPPVVLETVYFNRQSLTLYPDVGPVTFKGITDLSFHFTAPTFLSPEKTKFKYQLEGVDREWIFLPPGQERAAYYQDLAPGTYTFRVTACNAEGVWNQTGDSLTFTLKSRFYQTFLFKIAVLFLLTVILVIAFFIYKKKKLSSETREKYKGSTLNPIFAEECITRLKYLMEIEKVYCDANITLQSLAEKMSIAPHLLSQLLNEKMDRNFADFINQYRIEEAKNILKTPRGASRKISTVAIEVGFNTMAAFYNAFKKHANMTPTRYKKEVGHT
jgi:ligand-binding sensor domain-containing protein/AraC-like DNA-binding protein